MSIDRRRTTTALILLTAIPCFACLPDSPALGQQDGASVSQDLDPRTVGGREIVQLEGTLDAIARDRLKIKDKSGKEIFAVLTPASKMQYKGTADAKFLRPGFMVRFQAGFDVQRGNSITAVSEIEVFRPNGSPKLLPEDRKKQTPGIYPIELAGEKAQNARQGAQKIASGTNQKFLVVGQLQVIQASKLRVRAGNRAFIVDLQPETKISVSAGDVVYCLPGDKVTLTGIRNPGQGLVQVESLEIEATKLLGSESAKAGEKAEAKSETSNRRAGFSSRSRPRP